MADFAVAALALFVFKVHNFWAFDLTDKFRLNGTAAYVGGADADSVAII